MFTISNPPRSLEERHRAISNLCLADRENNFTVNMWHPATSCTGINCRQHPLFRSKQCVDDYTTLMHGSWGCWNESLYAEERARETVEETRKRLEAEAAREKQRAIAAEALRQAQYSQELAFRQSLKAPKAVRGAAPPPKKLILAPCKWLYAIDGKDGCFSNKPCSECWGHEYTDAKGEFRAPHKCEYVHQNQPEWKSEWNVLPVTRDRWRPAAPKSENRFEGLSQKGPAKKARAAGPSDW